MIRRERASRSSARRNGMRIRSAVSLSHSVFLTLFRYFFLSCCSRSSRSRRRWREGEESRRQRECSRSPARLSLYGERTVERAGTHHVMDFIRTGARFTSRRTDLSHFVSCSYFLILLLCFFFCCILFTSCFFCSFYFARDRRAHPSLFPNCPRPVFTARSTSLRPPDRQSSSTADAPALDARGIYDGTAIGPNYYHFFFVHNLPRNIDGKIFIDTCVPSVFGSG